MRTCARFRGQGLTRARVKDSSVTFWSLLEAEPLKNLKLAFRPCLFSSVPAAPILSKSYYSLSTPRRSRQPLMPCQHPHHPTSNRLFSKHRRASWAGHCLACQTGSQTSILLVLQHSQGGPRSCRSLRNPEELSHQRALARLLARASPLRSPPMPHEYALQLQHQAATLWYPRSRRVVVTPACRCLFAPESVQEDVHVSWL